MKESQLRKLIRESIKELMTEKQYNDCMVDWAANNAYIIQMQNTDGNGNFDMQGFFLDMMTGMMDACEHLFDYGMIRNFINSMGIPDTQNTVAEKKQLNPNNTEIGDMALLQKAYNIVLQFIPAKKSMR